MGRLKADRPNDGNCRTGHEIGHRFNHGFCDLTWLGYDFSKQLVLRHNQITVTGRLELFQRNVRYFIRDDRFSRRSEDVCICDYLRPFPMSNRTRCTRRSSEWVRIYLLKGLLRKTTRKLLFCFTSSFLILATFPGTLCPPYHFCLSQPEGNYLLLFIIILQFPTIRSVCGLSIGQSNMSDLGYLGKCV